MDNNNENEQDRKKLSNKINDIFGLPTEVSETRAVTLNKHDKNEIVIHDENNIIDHKQVDDDFNETRDTLKELEYMGRDVLDHFLVVAKESESPRAIEVFANFMKTMADISVTKLDLHEKRKKIKQSDDQPNSAGMNIKNANIIVGTTADILKKNKDD